MLTVFYVTAGTVGFRAGISLRFVTLISCESFVWQKPSSFDSSSIVGIGIGMKGALLQVVTVTIPGGESRLAPVVCSEDFAREVVVSSPECSCANLL